MLTSAASGVLLLAGWLIGLAGAPEMGSTAIYVVAIVTGGYYFGREAIEELIFEREIGIELLMSIAAVVATLMGQAAEGAMLVFLYSISEAAEGYTEEKTRSAIKALMDLAPKVALVRRDGIEQEIPVEELDVGDVFIVKPGESIATDGEVLEGASSVNQAPVTGESVPVEKQPGDTVFAGAASRLKLPVRPPRPEDDELPAFEPPEGTSLLDVEVLRTGQSNRFKRYDVANGSYTLTVVNDGGRRRIVRDGLEHAESVTDIYSIVEGDPLSAEVRCERTVHVGRGNWQTRVETASTMTSDADSFHVTNLVDAYEGNTRVFTKTWTFTVGRDHV